MDFTRISRQVQLREDVAAAEAEKKASESAAAGTQKQKEGTERRRQAQKDHMAQQTSTNMKSATTYTAEEYRREREYEKMYENAKSDWRKQLAEETDHPYVDVMPFINQKEMEAKKQVKGAEKLEGGKQAKMAEAKEMSIADQMRVSREAFAKRAKNPPVSREDQRAKQVAQMVKNTKKKSMTDATDPRPGSRFRGD